MTKYENLKVKRVNCETLTLWLVVGTVGGGEVREACGYTTTSAALGERVTVMCR